MVRMCVCVFWCVGVSVGLVRVRISVCCVCECVWVLVCRSWCMGGCGECVDVGLRCAWLRLLVKRMCSPGHEK